MQKSGRMPRILGAILLVIAGVMLCNRAGVFIAATYLSLLPVAAAGLYLLLFEGEKPLLAPGHRLQWGRAAICAGLALLWLCMLSVFEINGSRIFSATHLADAVYADSPFLARFYTLFHRLVYLPAICISAWYLLYCLLSRAASPADAPFAPPDEMERKKLIWRCELFIAIATVFGVMCVYPIYNVSDTLLLKQFIDTGEWNTWNTMGYLLFAFFTSLGGTNYFLVVVAQGCIWVYANYVALSLLSQRRCARRACVAYTALSLLSFLPYFYCGVMYKDGLFMSCMLGLCASLSALLDVQSPRARHFVRLGIFALGTSLFRLGTFPIVLSALLLLLLLRKKGRSFLLRSVVTLASVLIGYVGINTVLPRITHAKASSGYVMYTLPLNMIGAVAASGCEIRPDEQATMELLMPYDEWAQAYNPYFMDPLSRTDAFIGTRVELVDTLHLGPSLLRLNARFLLRYPRVYLTAFFNANSIVWEWGRPDDGRAAEWNWLLDYARKPMEAENHNVQTQIFGYTGIMTDLADATYRNVFYNSLVWRGGCSLFVLLLCAAVVLTKKKAAKLLALLPPVAYSALLMLSVPSQDPRYILPALVTAIFFTASEIIDR